MIMADLKTNYVDDVLDTTKNQVRKYQQIQNDDGTVSFVDVTEYTQVGTSFGAKDINDTNAAINAVNGKLTNIGTKIANVTINANAKEKIDIINALNTYNTKIPSGICIVNFKPDSDKNYYSGVITQKINDTYGLGIVFSYYNNSTVWIRLQDRVWKDT